MSKARANVNAFEQNKGVGTNATLWTSDRRKKKRRFRRARRNASRGAFIFCPF